MRVFETYPVPLLAVEWYVHPAERAPTDSGACLSWVRLCALPRGSSRAYVISSEYTHYGCPGVAEVLVAYIRVSDACDVTGSALSALILPAPSTNWRGGLDPV